MPFPLTELRDASCIWLPSPSTRHWLCGVRIVEPRIWISKLCSLARRLKRQRGSPRNLPVRSSPHPSNGLLRGLDAVFLSAFDRHRSTMDCESEDSTRGRPEPSEKLVAAVTSHLTRGALKRQHCVGLCSHLLKRFLWPGASISAAGGCPCQQITGAHCGSRTSCAAMPGTPKTSWRRRSLACTPRSRRAAFRTRVRICAALLQTRSARVGATRKSFSVTNRACAPR